MKKRPAPPSTRAAVYYRTSTEDQHPDNQRTAVEQLVAARELDAVLVFEEKASAHGYRPVFEAMMDQARRGAFKWLVIWSLDRFGRSLVGNIQALLELDRLGVIVLSAKESWLDTSSPVRGLLVAVMSWVAEQEAERNRLRALAGLERARRQGVRLGRPPLHVSELAVEALRGQGHSMQAIARKLEVSERTLYRRAAKITLPPGTPSTR